MLLFKLLVIGMLFAIIASLGTALFTLVRDKGGSQRTVKALTVRVALSVGLFLLLFAGFLAGIIAPHGVYPQ